MNSVVTPYSYFTVFFGGIGLILALTVIAGVLFVIAPYFDYNPNETY